MIVLHSGGQASISSPPVMLPRVTAVCIGIQTRRLGHRPVWSDVDRVPAGLGVGVMPGCRAPIPSKGKQRVGAVFESRKRSIEMRTAVCTSRGPRARKVPSTDHVDMFKSLPETLP
jgi:hypothetical protein